MIEVEPLAFDQVVFAVDDELAAHPLPPIFENVYSVLGNYLRLESLVLEAETSESFTENGTAPSLRFLFF